ncbi:MAG: glycosyltransferase family 4 protein [Acidobacteria bacterium]|nr:glycosyltransferase family 4 protein [Acidobacteriota bacterium]
MSSPTERTPVGRAAHKVRVPERKPLRVFMMDMLAMVPYYDGHLCAAMAHEAGVEVTLGAITYSYDQGYFHRQGVQNKPGIDVAARLTLPRFLRRAIKIVEAVVNLCVLAIRFLFNRPEVLHVQFLPMMEFGLPFERWMLRLAHALRIKVVHTVHNVLPPATKGRRRPSAQAKLYRGIYQSVDALICHDERAKARLVQEFSVSAERIWVIPHGPLFAETSLPTQETARSRLGVSRDTRLVLWQGIVEPYKGISFLLDAWREVADTCSDVQLAIVGTGSKEILDSVNCQVTALGIAASVRREPRFVSVEELACWYRAADVLVYPYQESTTSGALMTGINYGTAIVATATAGFQQLLKNNQNSLLVEYGNVQELAGALRRLISDDALRSRLSQRIRELQAIAPSWLAIARETHDCYKAVLPKTHEAWDLPRRAVPLS